MKYLLSYLLLFCGLSSVISQEEYRLITDSADKRSITKEVFDMQELEVKARKSDINLKSGSIGLDIDIQQIKMLPKLMGEADPYKALQYMGGVSQAGEANSGLYVRGGNNDQNLIMLNGTLIQNPTHVLGMFSVFNPDLIGQMRFVKSGMPAEYGGRLSSVVDINTINILPEKLKVDGSIGLISSRIAAQIPISPKFSVFAAWRGSYISSLILPALGLLGVDSTMTRNKYEYWDTNVGFNYSIAPRTKLSGHFYRGKDVLTIPELKEYSMKENDTQWGNTAAGLQLNHIFSDVWSMNHSLHFTKFDISSGFEWYGSALDLTSKLEAIYYKADFFHSIDNHKIKFGTELAYNNAIPHFVKTDSIIPVTINGGHNDIHSAQMTLYARDEWTLDKWQFNIGLRANFYAHLGPYTDYNSTANILYVNNQIIKTYQGLEPRIFGRYMLSRVSSLKVAATRHIQYLNQLPVFSFGLPTDLQMPASLYVKPQNSWHFTGGYFRNSSDNDWEFSTEIYYKTLDNQLEFQNGIETTFTNASIEKELMVGRGWTYGAEWKVSKTLGRFKGWASYNLAWSYRQFDAINSGMPFLARNDRRHDISIIGMYRINDRWDCSAVFVYATGNRLNLPLSWFMVDNKVILEYGRYNSFVMPAYHRMDISATYKVRNKGKLRSELNFSVYNLYNRANPFQVFYSTTDNANKQFNYQIKMAYLLPVIPSVSWVFHW